MNTKTIRFFLIIFITTVYPNALQRQLWACTDEEIDLIVNNAELTDDPVISIAQNPQIAQRCKNKIFNLMERSFKRRLKQGLCLSRLDGRNVCDSLEAAQEALKDLPNKFCHPSDSNNTNNDETCDLEPKSQTAIEKAEERIGQVLNQEIDSITNKIFLGAIAWTYLPEECAEPSRSCRQALTRQWFEDTIIEKSSSKQDQDEFWIDAGSYLHLLLSQGFSGTMSKQNGGTCGIYSGASLMEHYCLTPRRNPNAQFGQMTLEGPDFQCASADDFLDMAFETQIWHAQLCLEGHDGSNCQAINQIPYEGTIELLQNRYLNECAAAGKTTTKQCQKLDEETQTYRRLSAQEYLGQDAKKYPKAIIIGTTGIKLKSIPKLYERYGFETALIDPKFPNTWEQIEEALANYHPIQIQVDPKYWAQYNLEMTADHIILIEGFFMGPNYEKYSVIRESNFPNVVKIFPAETLRQSWISRDAPAVSLCTQNDDRNLCETARRTAEEQKRQEEKDRREMERLKKRFPGSFDGH